MELVILHPVRNEGRHSPQACASRRVAGW